MRRPVSSSLLFLLALSGAVPMAAAGRYVEVSYPPSTEPGELQFGVTHTMWIPDGVKTIRGVIVHQHGCGVGAAKGGRTAAYDLHWQALAKKWDMALLGPAYHVEREEQGCGWTNAKDGSAKVFLKALRELAAKAGHREIETAPWCLWGHSGGGSWSGAMQQLYPERIIAIWFRSGPVVPTAGTPAAAYEIPMMANPGVKEKDGRFAKAWTGSVAMFQAYRAKGAPIGFAPDPRTSHECGDSRYLAIPWFDACLRMRLPAKGSADQKPRAVATKGIWLGTPYTDQAQEAERYQGKQEESVWLPDAKVAKTWAEYVKTGAAGDSTPPAAPHGVNAVPSADGKGVEIRWEAEADFESGIGGFVIERDGQEVARIPEQAAGKYGRGLFQKMTYHDTPEAPLAEMRFVDGGAEMGKKHRYRVITVNSVGIRSKGASSQTTAR